MTFDPGSVFALYAIVGLAAITVLWCRDVLWHRRGHHASLRAVSCPVCRHGVKLERNMGRVRCRRCGVRFQVPTLEKPVKSVSSQG